MHTSKICIVKPGPKMHICEICIVMPCLRPILRGNKTCNQKQNLQQVLYFPVLAWKILFTKLAASFVGLRVSTKLALVLQHRLTTNTFVCQQLQHYRRFDALTCIVLPHPQFPHNLLFSLSCTSPPCWWQESKICWKQSSEGNAIQTMFIRFMNLPEDTANHQSGMTASGLHFSTLEFSPIPWPSLCFFCAEAWRGSHRPVEFSIDKERAGIARILKFVSIAEKNSVVVAWELLRSLDSPTCKRAFSPLNPIANASDSWWSMLPWQPTLWILMWCSGTKRHGKSCSIPACPAMHSCWILTLIALQR